MNQEDNSKCDEWIKINGKRKIQSFQDSFADIFNVSLGIIALNGKALTVWSNSSLFCHYISKNNSERCNRERMGMIDQVVRKRETIKYTCYMGITYFVCPIFYDNEMIAICLGGGICLEQNKGLIANKLIEDIPVFSESKLDDCVKLLENILNLLNISEDENSSTENRREEMRQELALLESKLTFREIEIVNKINDGLSNKEISAKLNISEKTVKTHVTNILRKLNLKDRLQIVIFCKSNIVE